MIPLGVRLMMNMSAEERAELDKLNDSGTDRDIPTVKLGASTYKEASSSSSSSSEGEKRGIFKLKDRLKEKRKLQR